MKQCFFSLILVLLVCRLMICQTFADDESQAEEKLLKNTNSPAKGLPQPRRSPLARRAVLDNPRIRIQVVKEDPRKWDHRGIAYNLAPNLAKAAREASNIALWEITMKTCVKFRYLSNPRDESYLSFTKMAYSCFTLTGKQRLGRHDVQLGTDCDYKKRVLHEIMHALGMYDEHVRPDRDKYIKLDFNGVPSNYYNKVFKKHLTTKKYVGLEPYDYSSVMHAPSNYLGKNKLAPTIMKLMPGGPKIGQRKGLSELDSRRINKFYGCKVDSKPTPKADKMELLSGHCNFDRGTCNWKNWKNGNGDDEDQFDWKFATEAKKYNGPLHDVSDNKAYGKFLYFTKPLSEDEQMNSAVLASGFFKGPNCLTFSYYMGSGGHLRVFIKESGSSAGNPYQFVMEKKGPQLQPDMWHTVRQGIPAKIKPYQIIIEGLKTPDLTGSVAVDDVFVFKGIGCNACPFSRVTFMGQCCKFPFQYKNEIYNRCIKTSPKEFWGEFWCGTTSNYDRDRRGDTCSDSNECYSNPCATGATCVDGYFNYTCICPAFKTGKNCMNDIDECLDKPCQHGKCQNLARGYTCGCTRGFTGKNCENDIDECKSAKKCEGARTCLNTPGSYKCLCPPGFTGPKCLQDIDECASSPCKNSVKCASLLNRFECTCLKEYTGKTCGDDVDECLDKPCLHGNCVNHQGGYSCRCTRGYTGRNCEFDIDECGTRKHVCITSEKCVNTPGSYKCACVEGYTGPKCQRNIDECANTPCKHRGMCANLINRFECTCLKGYTGKTCEVAIGNVSKPRRRRQRERHQTKVSLRGSKSSRKLSDAEQKQLPWGFYFPFGKFVRYKDETLMINCSTNDPTDYVLLWHKHQMLSAYEIVPDGKRIHQDGLSFILRNLTYQDSGLYTCHAIKGDERRIKKDMVNVTITKRKPQEMKNSKYPMESTTMNLNGSKPYIYFGLKSPVRMSIFQKKPWNLTATIKGQQPIKMHWKKDEHDLIIGNRFKTYNKKRRLVIEPPFVTKDSGTYSVTACNTNGCDIRGVQVYFQTSDLDISNTPKVKDVELVEILKKIGIIGGPTIIVFLGLVLVGLKMKKNAKKKDKKTKKRRKKRKERSQRGVGRLTSLWHWHDHVESEESSHDEMLDYSHVMAPDNQSLDEFFDIELDDEPDEGRTSHRSSEASRMYDNVTSYGNIYASYDGHVQGGIQPMMALVDEIPSSEQHCPYDNVTSYGNIYASYDGHVQGEIQPMMALVEEIPSSEPHAADTDYYGSSDDSFHTDESH